MNRMTIARTAGYGLVVAGILVTAAALLGPWSWRQGVAHARPDATVLLAVAALGPMLSTVRLVAAALEPPPVPPMVSALVAATGAVAAAGIAAVAAAGVSTLDAIAPGGPLAVAACVAAAVGWLIVAVTGRATARLAPVPVAAATATVLVVAVLGYASVRWLTETRHVEHRVAGDAPSAAAAPPVDANRNRWRSTVGGEAVAVAGRGVFLREPRGVRVLDAVTGEERWHYLRRDVPGLGAALSADGRTLVALWRADEGVLAIGFDAGTGARRWQYRHAGTWDPVHMAGVGGVMVSASATDLVALDVATGELRWSYRPRECRLGTILAADPSVLAVAGRCAGVPTVLGLSAVDGARRWTWTPPADVARLGDDLAMVPTAGGVLVQYGALAGSDTDDVPLNERAPRTTTVLSGGVGTAGATHRSPDPFAVSAGTTAVYVAGNVTAVDLAFGRPLWTATGLANGWSAVAAVVSGTVLLVVARNGTALKLVGFDTTNGATTLDRAVPGDGCGDGCTPRIFAGPGVAVISAGGSLLAVG